MSEENGFYEIIPMRPDYFNYLTMSEMIRSVLREILDGICQAKELGVNCNYPTEVHFTIGTSTNNIKLTVPFDNPYAYSLRYPTKDE